MIFNEIDYSTQAPITQLKQFEHSYDYTSISANFIPLEGEICVIYIPSRTVERSDLKFPSDLRTTLEDNKKINYGEEFLIIMGDGSSKISELPLVTYKTTNHIANYNYLAANRIKDIIPSAGQICLITVPKSAVNNPNFPLPNGVEEKSSKIRHYFKIGYGSNSLKDLPWVGEIEDSTLNNLSLKFLDTEEAKKKLDIQTNRYIGSSKGVSQINGIISNYLVNNDTGDDLGDGIIINCN